MFLAEEQAPSMMTLIITIVGSLGGLTGIWAGVRAVVNWGIARVDKAEKSAVDAVEARISADVAADVRLADANKAWSTKFDAQRLDFDSKLAAEQLKRDQLQTKCEEKITALYEKQVEASNRIAEAIERQHSGGKHD